MRTRRSRIGLLIAAGISLAVLQATPSYAETIQQGPWSISSLLGSNTYDTPKYTSTTGNVYTCVKASALNANASGWSFSIIWYNGGRATVVWSSRGFTDLGTHCSPTGEATESGNPEYFDAITLWGGDGVNEASGSGLWDLYLDCPDSGCP